MFRLALTYFVEIYRLVDLKMQFVLLHHKMLNVYAEEEIYVYLLHHICSINQAGGLVAAVNWNFRESFSFVRKRKKTKFMNVREQFQRRRPQMKSPREIMKNNRIYAYAKLALSFMKCWEPSLWPLVFQCRSKRCINYRENNLNRKQSPIKFLFIHLNHLVYRK